MVSAYNTLSSARSMGAQAVSALQLLETMQSQELTPKSAYNSAISACANGGQAVAAVQFSETMQSQELTPNVIAYSSVIRACVKGVGTSRHYNSSRR